MRTGGPRLLAGDVVGADQLAENALELLAADARRPADMVKADLPVVRTRQQIAEHAFGLDRQPIIAENSVRNNGELCAMFAANDCHRGVASANNTSVPTARSSARRAEGR